MRRRIFDNKAKRAWWLVHVEAWRKSGLTAAAYCRVHGLSVGNFRTWRREITEWEGEKAIASQRRKGARILISKDKRRQATQAFWAMHVEAWTWSGLHLRDYTAAHRLSPYSLKKWRNMFDNEELVIDWRTMLHASALPLISTKIGTSAKEKATAARLTAAIEADAPPPKRATRRRWKTEEKIALLLQAERHGSTITSVAQAHGIATSVMFRWRDQLGVGKDDPAVILPVRLVEGRERSGSATPGLLADLLPRPDGMIEVALADGRLNILVAGGTSSGKTTLANALLAEMAWIDGRPGTASPCSPRAAILPSPPSSSATSASGATSHAKPARISPQRGPPRRSSARIS